MSASMVSVEGVSPRSLRAAAHPQRLRPLNAWQCGQVIGAVCFVCMIRVWARDRGLSTDNL